MRTEQPKMIYLKDYQAPEYLIDETHLTFELFEDHSLVHAQLVMRRNPERGPGLPPLVLDGQQLDLLSVTLADHDCRSAVPADREHLTLQPTSTTFTVDTSVRIHPETNTALEGLYKSSTMFCTQCEAEGFRKITYYLDRPDVMSTFTTTVVAEQHSYPVLLSNGNPIATGPGGDGRHWATWQDPFKKPAYLFALVAGDLWCVEDTFTTMSERNVALRIYVEPENIDKCQHAMDSLKKSMRWDEEVYGREYDLDIFMIVAVNDFNMGAMENKGLNIFNSSAVLARAETATDAAHQRVEAIVAHEYFHNWSGNRVTCRDWFQLSLKEGFTVFRDAGFLRRHELGHGQAHPGRGLPAHPPVRRRRRPHGPRRAPGQLHRDLQLLHPDRLRKGLGSGRHDPHPARRRRLPQRQRPVLRTPRRPGRDLRRLHQGHGRRQRRRPDPVQALVQPGRHAASGGQRVL